MKRLVSSAAGIIGAAVLLGGGPGPSTAALAAGKSQAASSSTDYEELTARGLRLFHKGESDLALADFNRAIKANRAKAGDAFAYRALIHYNTGNYKQAMSDADEAVRRKPDQPDGWNTRGLALTALKKFDDAVSNFDEAVRLTANTKTEARPRANRGLAYEGMGKSEEAAADFKTALVIDPSLDSAKQGLDRLNASCVAVRDPNAMCAREEEALMNDTDELVKQGKHAEAIAIVDKAVVEHPKYVALLSYRAALHKLAGEFDAAAEDAYAALRLDPKHAMAYFALCAVKTTQGQDAEAEKNCGRAVELDPTNVEVYAFHAGALARLKRPSEAMPVVNEAIRRAPNGASMSYYVRASLHMDTRQLDLALADIDKAISMVPAESKFHTLRGIIAYTMGARERAIEDFHKAIKTASTDGDLTEALSNRGAVYESMGLTDLALADYRATVAAKATPGAMQRAEQGLKRLDSRRVGDAPRTSKI